MKKEDAIKKCRYCDRETELCRAHLYPKSLFKYLKGNNQNASLIGIKDKDNPRQGHKPINILQSLIFDKNILCASCDNQLGYYDDYLIEVLREYNNHPKRNGRFNENSEGIELIELSMECEKFQLGVLASLWRLSLAKKISFDIGDKYHKLIKKWLKNKNIPESERHLCDIILLGCYNNDGFQEAITTPLQHYKCDFDSYRFMIKNLVFIVNVGNEKEKKLNTCPPISTTEIKVLNFSKKIKILLLPPDILSYMHEYFLDKNNNRKCLEGFFKGSEYKKSSSPPK